MKHTKIEQIQKYIKKTEKILGVSPRYITLKDIRPNKDSYQRNKLGKLKVVKSKITKEWKLLEAEIETNVYGEEYIFGMRIYWVR